MMAGIPVRQPLGDHLLTRHDVAMVGDRLQPLTVRRSPVDDP